MIIVTACSLEFTAHELLVQASVCACARRSSSAFEKAINWFDAHCFQSPEQGEETRGDWTSDSYLIESSSSLDNDVLTCSAIQCSGSVVSVRHAYILSEDSTMRKRDARKCDRAELTWWFGSVPWQMKTRLAEIGPRSFAVSGPIFWDDLSLAPCSKHVNISVASFMTPCISKTDWASLTKNFTQFTSMYVSIVKIVYVLIKRCSFTIDYIPFKNAVQENCNGRMHILTIIR